MIQIKEIMATVLKQWTEIYSGALLKYVKLANDNMAVNAKGHNILRLKEGVLILFLLMQGLKTIVEYLQGFKDDNPKSLEISEGYVEMIHNILIQLKLFDKPDQSMKRTDFMIGVIAWLRAQIKGLKINELKFYREPVHYQVHDGDRLCLPMWLDLYNEHVDYIEHDEQKRNELLGGEVMEEMKVVISVLYRAVSSYEELGEDV